MDLPMLIKRCLAYGVAILPYELNQVLEQYESKKIPDDILATMDISDLNEYVRGLSLCGEEMAGDWTRGHEILKKLGFKENIRSEGHRNFVYLEFVQ